MVKFKTYLGAERIVQLGVEEFIKFYWFYLIDGGEG